MFIVSCSRENVLPEPEMEETYSFTEIQYYADEDSREFSFYDFPSVTFYNGTDAEITYPYTMGGYNESSHFVSDDWDSFHLEGMAGVKIAVPENIDENNKIYLGSKRWEYIPQVQYQESGFSSSSNVIALPRSGITINCRISLKHYKANYKLTLRGDITGTYKVVEGIWTGTFYNHYTYINFQQSDL